MATSPDSGQIRFELNETRERVVLQLPGGPITLGAAEVERLALQLGDLRATMNPGVGPNPTEGSCPALDTPLFAAQITPDQTRVALGVRTPTFGWIALMLDRGQVEGLGKFLSDTAPTMAPRPH
ncbi:MAG: hypothetical protein HS109_10685 [Burkholderiales bacterium]|nr:hypothetical protein [Burkholderiales bacterium]